MSKHLSTTLVDHHVLAQNDKVFDKTVVRIFDHRPINSEEICRNEDLEATIKPVGSCCTLITGEILRKKPEILFQELAFIIYGNI